MAIQEQYKATEVFLNLKRKCKQVGGFFGVLWHNYELTGYEKPKIYSITAEN